MALPYRTDAGTGTRATLGVIVLRTDETLENEFRTLFPRDGVALHHARIPSRDAVTPETLREMERDLPAAAALLSPAIPFDAIGYGCTSGATLIGRDRVAALIGDAHPAVRTTDPISAVMAACRALGVTSLGFLTPYVAEVSAAMRRLLEDNGFRIATFGSYEEADEHSVARIAETSTLDAVLQIGAEPRCEAVFVSCTNLRTLGIIAAAEARLGKPVLSSNTALAWHLGRLAGLEGQDGPGRLFRSRDPNPGA